MESREHQVTWHLNGVAYELFVQCAEISLKSVYVLFKGLFSMKPFFIPLVFLFLMLL